MRLSLRCLTSYVILFLLFSSSLLRLSLFICLISSIFIMARLSFSSLSHSLHLPFLRVLSHVSSLQTSFFFCLTISPGSSPFLSFIFSSSRLFVSASHTFPPPTLYISLSLSTCHPSPLFFAAFVSFASLHLCSSFTLFIVTYFFVSFTSSLSFRLQ